MFVCNGISLKKKFKNLKRRRSVTMSKAYFGFLGNDVMVWVNMQFF